MWKEASREVHCWEEEEEDLRLFRLFDAIPTLMMSPPTPLSRSCSRFPPCYRMQFAKHGAEGGDA